jgi:pyridoxal biosynthesis lyase PdxS
MTGADAALIHRIGDPGLMAQVVVFHSGDPGDRRGGQLTAVSQVSRWVASWP